MHTSKQEPTIFGVIAEYSDGEAVLAAAQAARDAGFKKMDAYTPYMVEGLVDALGNKDDRVPRIVFICGLICAGLGFLMQYWITGVDYPMNIGGRPNLSWPSYIPITFESGVLVAAFSAVVGMFGLNGLPRPHHPVFDAPGFDRATRDKFFLCIEAEDEGFDARLAKEVLLATKPDSIQEVPNL